MLMCHQGFSRENESWRVVLAFCSAVLVASSAMGRIEYAKDPVLLEAMQYDPAYSSGGSGFSRERAEATYLQYIRQSANKPQVIAVYYALGQLFEVETGPRGDWPPDLGKAQAYYKAAAEMDLDGAVTAEQLMARTVMSFAGATNLDRFNTAAAYYGELLAAIDGQWPADRVLSQAMVETPNGRVAMTGAQDTRAAMNFRSVAEALEESTRKNLINMARHLPLPEPSLRKLIALYPNRPIAQDAAQALARVAELRNKPLERDAMRAVEQSLALTGDLDGALPVDGTMAEQRTAQVETSQVPLANGDAPSRHANLPRREWMGTAAIVAIAVLAVSVLAWWAIIRRHSQA
jgi:hypothetical protein